MRKIEKYLIKDTISITDIQALSSAHSYDANCVHKAKSLSKGNGKVKEKSEKEGENPGMYSCLVFCHDMNAEKVQGTSSGGKQVNKLNG